MLNNIKIDEELKLKEFLITEKFGVSPIGLDVVGKLGNTKLYGSSKLQNNFLDAIRKQKFTKPCGDAIEDLTEKGIIIPCYTTGNLISYLALRLFGSKFNKSTMAFFSPDTNKIYMLFDNRVKYFMWTDDEDLSATVLHELQHFACFNLKQQFYSLFKNMCSKFYSTFFNYLFDSRYVTQHITDDINKFLMKSFEWSTSLKESDFNKYEKLLQKNLDINISADPEWMEKAIPYYIYSVKLYLLDPNKYIRFIYSREGMPFLIFICLIKAYNKLGYNRLNSLFVQECLYPSEIAAITAGSRPQQIHYQAVKLTTSKF